MYQSKQDILNNCSDFLYVYAPDAMIKAMGSRVGAIITNKRYNEKTLIWRVFLKAYGSKAAATEPYSEFINTELYNRFTTIYGITPTKILYKLASGENVAGKNWSEGVYGVAGQVKGGTQFTQDGNVTVDSSTGKILYKGTEVAPQTPIYKASGSKTYVAGYSCEINGAQYSSEVQGTTYKKTAVYQAATYSATTDGVTVKQWWNGTSYDESGSSSIWQSILTNLPDMQTIIDWVTSLLNSLLSIDVTSNRTTLTTANTTPDQSEFVYEDNSSNALLIGGLLLGGGLLLSGGLMKKKKSN